MLCKIDIRKCDASMDFARLPTNLHAHMLHVEGGADRQRSLVVDARCGR